MWKTGLKKVFEAVFAYKPDVNRGEQRGAARQRYVCYGHRKDPLGCGLGQYSHKRGVDPQDDAVLRTDRAMKDLQAKFQEIGRTMVPPADGRPASFDGGSTQIHDPYCGWVWGGRDWNTILYWKGLSLSLSP